MKIEDKIIIGAAAVGGLILLGFLFSQVKPAPSPTKTMPSSVENVSASSGGAGLGPGPTVSSVAGAKCPY